jgi:hypothetical protein
MKKSQTRVLKTLEGKPEFVMSFVETQNELKKLARYKTNNLCDIHISGDPILISFTATLNKYCNHEMHDKKA